MEIETSSEKIILDPKLIWNFIILIAIGVIITFLCFVIFEISSAKKECEKIDGKYELKNFQHFCDNEPFYKFTDGSWNYEQKSINLSEIIK